eukprot:Clim_evm38s242 gene=Clim_evmTU38s242
MAPKFNLSTILGFAGLGLVAAQCDLQPDENGKVPCSEIFASDRKLLFEDTIDNHNGILYMGLRGAVAPKFHPDSGACQDWILTGVEFDALDSAENEYCRGRWSPHDSPTTSFTCMSNNNKLEISTAPIHLSTNKGVAILRGHVMWDEGSLAGEKGPKPNFGSLPSHGVCAVQHSPEAVASLEASTDTPTTTEANTVTGDGLTGAPVRGGGDEVTAQAVDDGSGSSSGISTVALTVIIVVGVAATVAIGLAVGFATHRITNKKQENKRASERQETYLADSQNSLQYGNTTSVLY